MLLTTIGILSLYYLITAASQAPLYVEANYDEFVTTIAFHAVVIAIVGARFVFLFSETRRSFITQELLWAGTVIVFYAWMVYSTDSFLGPFKQNDRICFDCNNRLLRNGKNLLELLALGYILLSPLKHLATLVFSIWKGSKSKSA
jgi:hypothetical protein